MSDQVGNPEDRFSHNEAQIKSTIDMNKGVHYFLFFALKHKLWVPVRTASMGRF